MKIKNENENENKSVDVSTGGNLNIPKVYLDNSGDVSLKVKSNVLEVYNKVVKHIEYLQLLQKKGFDDEGFVIVKNTTNKLKILEGGIDTSIQDFLHSFKDIKEVVDLAKKLKSYARDNRLSYEKIYKEERNNRKKLLVDEYKKKLKDFIVDYEDVKRVSKEVSNAVQLSTYDIEDYAKGFKTLESLRSSLYEWLISKKDTYIKNIKEAKIFIKNEREREKKIKEANKNYNTDIDTKVDIKKKVDDTSAVCHFIVSVEENYKDDFLKEVKNIAGVSNVFRR